MTGGVARGASGPLSSPRTTGGAVLTTSSGAALAAVFCTAASASRTEQISQRSSIERPTS
ncbi:MAG: hypothetical protein EXR72_12880 [Myxococcales bacterium]|nr:hypothetical protein [Myxococcales bacterium]